ncbi:acyltransferase family protein [Thiocystis violacea]|uniref:acyltransferase family protein n=1 Tax=Thiocystis violacea TaxID=13725 RepID=UPI0019059B0E|nr:acyltransferase [Thiocystis violacea]MBK1723060.1 hypothetical protein [Thiocystis violacea]
MTRGAQNPSQVEEPFVRLDFLDALRGFAAYYVLVYHLALIPNPHLAVPDWLALYAGSGGTGVTLFFVLSAFALSYSLDARRGEPSLTLHFYLRRFFRIAPLFYAMLLAYFVRDWLFFETVHGPREILINASMLFNLTPEHTLGYVWASWTIGVEILFYILFPLVHRAIRNLADAVTLFLICVLLSQGWIYLIDHQGATLLGLTAEQLTIERNHGFLRHLPAFLMGVVCYRLYFDYLIRLREDQKRRYGRLLLVCFVVLYTALLTGRLEPLLWDVQVWQAICYATLILGLGLRPMRTLVNPATVRLGKISYSLYLLHPSLVFALAPLYYWLYGVMPGTSAAFLAAYGITAAMLTSLAWVSYRQIERRGIGWGESVISRLQAPRRAVSANA